MPVNLQFVTSQSNLSPHQATNPEQRGAATVLLDQVRLIFDR